MTHEILAPISGEVVELATVPDPVFSERLTGDGLAIELASDVVLAPAAGTISLFFATKHAFAITTDDGVQILVHVGLDSVLLNGDGLQPMASRGDRVEAGQPILKLDLEKFRARHINLTSPVLIVNYEHVKNLQFPQPGTPALAGETAVLSYEL